MPPPSTDAGNPSGKSLENRQVMLSVSIIVPCYNEKARIQLLLDAIYAQTYPRSQMEVVIADGLSTDGTRMVISDWSDAHPALKLQIVDNEKQIIPSALNRSIENATGEIIVRLDAHSQPYPDYVARIVSALEDGLADNVGGIWEIKPGADTWIAESIAVAASHPLGVGDALYRHARKAAYVDTVPFGAFRRELWERIGKFDETLLTNEDYEFNVRIINTSGRIWLNPEIRSIYFSRSTIGELIIQYWRYGFWKYRMLKRYPKTLRWRQALPPLFVLTLLMDLLLAWIPVFAILLILELLLYSFALIIIGLKEALRTKKASFSIGIPLSIASMHLSWGSGFLWSAVSGVQPR
jgi:succinoglycan biosynthesis protein ExoA